MDHGHGRSFSVTKIMPLSSVIMSMAEFDFLVSFLQGLASENVNFPYFGGLWMNYLCHSETTSN